MHPKISLAIFPLTERAQCIEGLSTSFQGVPVNSRHGAPPTTLPDEELNWTNFDTLQRIFLPRFQATDDDVWTESSHVHRFLPHLFKSFVQVGERFMGGEQKRCLICQ